MVSCLMGDSTALASAIVRCCPRKYNHIYGIALPKSDAERCRNLIKKNWALKHLKIRLYGAFYKDGQLTAVEYLPKDIYE